MLYFDDTDVLIKKMNVTMPKQIKPLKTANKRLYREDVKNMMQNNTYSVNLQGVRQVSVPVREVSTPVRGTVHDCPQAVRDCPQGVRDAVRGRPWTVKAARNAENKRTVGSWKQVVSLLTLIVSLLSTMTEQEPKIQIISYLVFCSVFFMFDPLDVLTRILAPQSCNLLAICQILVIVGILKPNEGYMIVMVMLVAGSLIAIRFFNTRWLASHNWLMSAAVQKALLIDADNKATRAWASHGRRETRTLLHELGHDADDSLLDILHRPVYLCGFLNGFEKTTKVKSRMEALQSKVDKYSESLQEAKKENKNLKDELAEIKKERDDLQANLTEMEYIYNNIQSLYSETQKENARLRAANEELLNGLPETEELPEVLTEEAQIRHYLNQGMSIRKISEIMKIPKCRIERVKKQDNAMDSNIYVVGAIAQ